MLQLILTVLLVTAPLAGTQPLEPTVAVARAGTTWTGTIKVPDDSTLDFSVELDKDSGTLTIPMQKVKDAKLSGVSVTDKEMKFSVPAFGAYWEMKLADDGKTAVGKLKQNGFELDCTMKRLEAGETAAKELVRPQDPKPPFPYDSSEVSFENTSAHVKLAGTLLVPKSNGPLPCVVLVTGSGPQNRDEELMGHKPFLVIADHLARHGIAVLRYDDRGTAKSTGKFADATSDDFADDALAAVTFLTTRKEFDPKKIGIIGHSEGGLIAPMCAVKSPNVAFIVLLAGPGISGAKLLPLQGKLIAIAEGTPAADAELESKQNADLLAALVAGKTSTDLKPQMKALVLQQLKSKPENKDKSDAELTTLADKIADDQSKSLDSPWLKRFLALDPRESLLHVTCPVLALNGEKDLQVPPKENLTAVQAALQAGGNKDFTTRELPNLNHLFQTCKTGSPSEYAKIEETISPAALDEMTTWIRKHSGRQ
jgi:pimeloyl-ACP methyl ester carboxylesterase